MNTLFISSFIPKSNAPQAGVNFSYNFIKILREELKSKVDLLCTINDGENENEALEVSTITDNQYLFKLSKKRKLFNVLKSPFIPSIASVRYDSRVLQKIRSLANTKKYDYVILDYTQNLNYYKCIQKLFKDCRIISLEQDVSFLGLDRKIKNTSGIKKMFYRFEYSRLKSYELTALKNIDKVYTVNEKDKELLKDIIGVEALYPFINKWEMGQKKHEGFNLMFWGAMNRKENEDAVMYFVKSIWEQVDKKNIKFFIIGANPSDQIKKLESENITVTGFVEDPAEYFQLMDLSIVPLRLGAGVKIKVLESMANGIPVITTTIGAEGIYAKNERDIIITDNPKDFAYKINNLKNDITQRETIKKNGMSFINDNYGFEKNKQILKDYIL
ncbi:glycosyl transferase [Clostridium folliculivorans]|uniref:Glycosyl transferase n=1 Tax=Clostridium folliculivorans TaxID=2886038 RepID=A0A9W5Y6A9_9CLOT|nr:glycosyltransferase family 4 protein [Clostridium folliculivorans]GKU27278.1 glycosyl transferase [Clostridium folliculivorans]